MRRLRTPGIATRQNGASMTGARPHDPVGPVPEVRVRRIRDSEGEALRTMRLDALRSEPMAYGSTYERDAAREPSHWVDLVRRNAEGSSEGVWVGELPTGRLVGMIGAFSHEGDRYVWGMWVAPGLRGSGLGGRLLDVLIAWAFDQRPTPKLRLDVNPAQAAALRLYQGRGFQDTGRRKPLHHTPDVLTYEMVRPPPK